MTNVEALKEVYVALGGSADDFATVTTNDQAIHLISTVIASAIAGALPSVSGTDNGKILMVKSGKWAKADAELPKVTATNNGQVLTVVSGAWANANLPS